MSFLLRFCLGLVVLMPSLAHATFNLENPADGSPYSGLGVISGWKCETSGALTARIYDEDMVLAWPTPIPLVYGSERTDVRANGSCRENGHDNVGFVAIWNWGNLEHDGTYTVVVQEDEVELARSTVTVTMLGPEEKPQVLEGASGECRIPNFPIPGETTTFQWNQATQHLEAVSRRSSNDLRECEEGLTVEPGGMCSFFFSDTSFGEIDGIFSVNAEGQGCVEVDIAEIPCFNTDQDFDTLLRGLGISGIEVTKNADGSWTIDSYPTDL